MTTTHRLNNYLQDDTPSCVPCNVNIYSKFTTVTTTRENNDCIWKLPPGESRSNVKKFNNSEDLTN